jgi:hypothetical protein
MIAAAKRELHKIGKMYTEVDFGRYGQFENNMSEQNVMLKN